MELRWRALGVEGSLDSSVVDVAPQSIIHRVGDVSPLSWSLQSIPQLASYPQVELVGIVPPHLANGLRRLGACDPYLLVSRVSSPSSDYDPSVLPYDS